MDAKIASQVPALLRDAANQLRKEAAARQEAETQLNQLLLERRCEKIAHRMIESGMNDDGSSVEEIAGRLEKQASRLDTIEEAVGLRPNLSTSKLASVSEEGPRGKNSAMSEFERAVWGDVG